jgi:hypothetical protein
MAENTIAADAHVRKHLEQINQHLQLIHSGIMVSAHALRYQNCEHDEDIASVLIYCLSARLAVQIERISEITGQLEPTDLDLGEPQEADGSAVSCH